MSRNDATEIFLAGVEAVMPVHFIPSYIKVDDECLYIGSSKIPFVALNNIYVAAAGKAAAAMALETEKIAGKYITEGLVVTKYEHALPLKKCKTIEAGHPVPDNNSIRGGNELLSLFKKAGKNDLIIMLVSGGASALVADCPPGIDLKDIQQTVQLLLHCGASIDEINTIRKHLSLLKGGQLVQYTEATVISLILSDVPGDDLSVIASGLTVADNSSFEDAWTIISRYALINELPASVRQWLQRGVEKLIQDTPKPGSDIFKKVHNIIVANNNIALQASAQKAKQLGYVVQIFSTQLSGEAAEKAIAFAEALHTLGNREKTCLLWGGETTVTIKGKGKGGRNQEFALAALCAGKKQHHLSLKNITILSGGTDGTDGPTDAAGAVIDEYSLSQTTLNPCDYLANNDAYHFFKQAGGLLFTGPTQTNVMDIVIGLINPV
ncbi:MAG: DUF4147 domain-containing protein [Chitinophagaceae bacterium]|nr:DUF4147 domain-containing protein [Chitinophagaceae bacterium]